MLLANLNLINGFTLGDLAFGLLALFGLMFIAGYLYYLAKKKFDEMAKAKYEPSQKELRRLAIEAASQAAHTAINQRNRNIDNKTKKLEDAAKVYAEMQQEKNN